MRAGAAAAGADLTRAAPGERLALLADAGSLAAAGDELDAARPSPHLARWSLAARADDGIVFARGAIHGAPVLIAAQDETFLAGSVGAAHARALCTLFTIAARERPAAVVLLLASGGVRLHEANPAEVALARTLRAMLDARAAGVPVIALGVADVFGGAAVLAAATERFGMLPGTRAGVSGPKVIATHLAAAGGGEEPVHMSAVFSAEDRSAAGQVDLVANNVEAVRAWVIAAARAAAPFAETVSLRHAALARACRGTTLRARGLPDEWQRASDPAGASGALWKVRDREAWIAAPFRNAPVGGCELHALDDDLLTHVLPRGEHGAKLVLIEDSAGHEASLAAEARGLARYLAHHAAVLARLRAAGVQLVGLLDGAGHGAAFFANALQAPAVFATPRARVMAMAPAAVARVTKLAPDALARHLEHDPVVGHGIDGFAHWGALTGRCERLDRACLDALLG